MAKKINLRLKDYDVSGKKTKNTKSLQILTNSTLSNSTLSNAILKPDQKVKKETLIDEEKILFFMSGNATVELNEEKFTVQAKDVLLLPQGSVYSIENYSSIDLHYNIVATRLK